MTARRPRTEPRKKPVQRRSRETVASILTAAAQVFDRHGMEGGTTNRIAARAGVSIGTLYQYFPGKEAIAAALLEEHNAQAVELIETLVARARRERPSVREGLQEYVGAMLAFHSGHPRLQHILLEEVPRSEALHRSQAETRAKAVDAVARLMSRSGDVGRPDPSRAAYMLVEAVEALTHRYAAHPESQTMEASEFVEEVVTMLEAYLTLPPGAVRPRQPEGHRGRGGPRGEGGSSSTARRTGRVSGHA